MTQIPIACTLSEADKVARGDEWRQFRSANVTEYLRTDSSVRMRLIGGDDVIVTAVDLARREKECCAFFEFRLELSDTVWLEVTVPVGAESLLDAFADSGTAYGGGGFRAVGVTLVVASTTNPVGGTSSPSSKPRTTLARLDLEQSDHDCTTESD